jgi:hypothetical protein
VYASKLKFAGLAVPAALVIGLFSNTAHAIKQIPLIEKSSGGGYMPPEYMRSEQCKVFADRIVREKSFGVDANRLITLHEEFPIKLSGDLTLMISLAEKEPEKRGNDQICDAPTTQIVVHQVNAKAGDPGFVVFSSAGCGSPSIKREGPHSAALTEIVDMYCPQTWNVGGK